MNGLLGRAALTVDRDAGNVLRQATNQRTGASDVSGLGADLVEVAEHDVLDGLGVDLGAFHEGSDCVPADVGRMDLRQTATPAANGGADGIDDEGF